MKISRKILVGFVIVLLLVTAVTAFAAVTFDPATGTGFVGKGDVQLIYGWNNQQLQANASLVGFRSVVVSERTWVCTNSRNENTQERERTITTTSLLSKIDRVKNQITGFILGGYVGTPLTETEGPQLNSCPAAASGWYLSSPAGDPVVVSSGIQVSIDGGANWFDLN